MVQVRQLEGLRGGPMKGDDRRVLRTRRLLRQALLELIGEKGYEPITIRDLTDRADIGYATFFRHYQGIDELMLEIFTGIIEDLEGQAQEGGADYFEREGRMIFESVARSPSLYKAILGSQAFSRKLRGHVQDMMATHLSSHGAQSEAAPIPLDIAALHMVSSLLALLDWWLAHGMDPSVERMAAIYERLIIRATWQALTPGLKLRLPWESGS
jgi:AcrR family transcriptional regulator